MSPIEDATARLQALPFTLSTGQNLVDWLILKRFYPPHDAHRAREEYQRFLALALTAPEGQATLPGPHIASLWQTHRADTAAYAAFTAALGTNQLAHTHPRRSLATDPAWPQTRARYRTAFGPPPALWWPAPLALWGWLAAFLFLAIWIEINLLAWITSGPSPSPMLRLSANVLLLFILLSRKPPLRLNPWRLLSPTRAACKKTTP